VRNFRENTRRLIGRTGWRLPSALRALYYSLTKRSRRKSVAERVSEELTLPGSPRRLLGDPSPGACSPCFEQFHCRSRPGVILTAVPLVFLSMTGPRPGDRSIDATAAQSDGADMDACHGRANDALGPPAAGPKSRSLRDGGQLVAEPLAQSGLVHRTDQHDPFKAGVCASCRRRERAAMLRTFLKTPIRRFCSDWRTCDNTGGLPSRYGGYGRAPSPRASAAA